MSVWDAVVMGIVEGLTEYLPVSSTGHLIITQYLLGLPATKAVKAFEVCIQSGAILAVLSIYFGRVSSVFKGLVGKSREGVHLLINLIAGFLPAAVLGLALHQLIKEYLFTAETVAVAWVLGGLLILAYVRYRQKKDGVYSGDVGKTLDQMTWKDALTVGMLQCIAMCPGTSRSLMTMLGGMFVGLSVSAAVEFSFLLGLVTLGAATFFDAWDAGSDMVTELGWPALIVGTVVSWGAAWLAVKWMVGYLQKHSLALFGWYRIAAAIVLAILIAKGLSVSDSADVEESPANSSQTELVSNPS